MKLTEKTLMKFARGVIGYTKENGYILFSRFGKNQRDFINQDSFDRGWRNWSRFTGGVSLEFKTDSENISFATGHLFISRSSGPGSCASGCT